MSSCSGTRTRLRLHRHHLRHLERIVPEVRPRPGSDLDHPTVHTRQQLLAVLDRAVRLGEGVDARGEAGEGNVTFRLTATLAFASPGSTTIAASPAFLPSPADAFMPPFALPPVLHAAKTTTLYETDTPWG